MATIKLHDVRDPMVVGREVFETLKRTTEDIEILTDREALSHAFYDACEEVGSTWDRLADRTAHAVGEGSCRGGKQAIEARQDAARAIDVAYTLMGLIWETTPSILEAEERMDPQTGELIPRSPGEILASLGVGTAEENDARLEAPGPYDSFPDDDDDGEMVPA